MCFPPKALFTGKEKRKTIGIEKEEKKLNLLRKFTPIIDFMFNGTTNKIISHSKVSRIHHRKCVIAT